MILSLLVEFIKSCMFLTGSYSNNIFPAVLSKEQEDKYIELMLQGDTKARNKLIEHNLRLVAHIVKKFESKNDNMDDLISIGTIGLIKGVDSYSKEHKTKITTYCARCIENEILMYFRADKKNENNVSLNDSLGYDKDGKEVNLIDILKDNSPDYLTLLHNKDSINLLIKYLNKLTLREQQIIIKRYGLYNTQEKTQKEIAKELNISRSYVSRIEKRALTKILKEFIIAKHEI